MRARFTTAHQRLERAENHFQRVLLFAERVDHFLDRLDLDADLSALEVVLEGSRERR